MNTLQQRWNQPLSLCFMSHIHVVCIIFFCPGSLSLRRKAAPRRKSSWLISHAQIKIFPIWFYITAWPSTSAILPTIMMRTTCPPCTSSFPREAKHGLPQDITTSRLLCVRLALEKTIGFAGFLGKAIAGRCLLRRKTPRLETIWLAKAKANTHKYIINTLVNGAWSICEAVESNSHQLHLTEGYH